MGIRLQGLGAGPEATEVSGLQIRFRGDVEIDNLTFRDTMGRPISILPLTQVVNVRVSHCVFRGNSHPAAGGAIKSAYQGIGSYLEVEGCLFEDNVAGEGGGAINSDSNLTVRNSSFIDNRAEYRGGAVKCFDHLLIEGCLFWKNSAAEGSGVWVGIVHEVRNSTFWANENGSAFFSGSGTGDILTHCIVGGTVNGYGIECLGFMELRCSVISFNDLGNWGWCEAGGSSGVVYDVDPEFCDPESGDFELKPTSPCIEGFLGSQECGLVGAYGIGCGGTPVEESSWGEIKWRFR